MAIRVTMIGAAVALWAIAASAAAGPAATSPDPPPLPGTAWVLSALPGHQVPPAAAATARFGDAEVQGTDGCNRYTAPYTASHGALKVGPRGAATQMMCPPEVMRQAEAFMAAFTRATGYRIAKGHLELLGTEGAVLAAFGRQPDTLAETSWRVTGYNNGKQAVVTLLSATNLTLHFSEDGRVVGSAGCNRYTARYAAKGANLAIGPAAATRRTCASPADVMEQEQAFLKSLEGSISFRIEGTQLELRDAAGALMVAGVRAGGS